MQDIVIIYASWPPDPDILRIHRLGQQAGGKKSIGDFLLFTQFIAFDRLYLIAAMAIGGLDRI
ncbi:hypothetical protein D3C76_1630420 [compost metagenome]